MLKKDKNNIKLHIIIITMTLSFLIAIIGLSISTYQRSQLIKLNKAQISSYRKDDVLSEYTGEIVIIRIYFILSFCFLFLIFICYLKSKKIQKINTKKWHVFTEIPKTKLNILSAMNIYDSINLPQFINTIFMKLSYNKILKINENENKNNNKELNDNNEIQEEIFLSILKKQGFDFNENNIKKIIRERRLYDKFTIKRVTRLSKEKLNNLIFILNLKEYKERKIKNNLDKDEEIIIDFLISCVIKSYVKSDNNSFKNYTKKYISELKIENIKMKNADWEIVEKMLKEEILNKLDEIYIEQSQILFNLYFYELTLTSKIKSELKNNKKELIKNKILLSENKSIDKFNIFYAVTGFLDMHYFAVIPVFLVLAVRIFNLFIITIPLSIFILLLAIIIEITMYTLTRKTVKNIKIPFTEKGINIYYEFDGLKNFLSNISTINLYDEKSIVLWGEFLVLATYFGINNEALKVLKQSQPDLIENMEKLNLFTTHEKNLRIVRFLKL